MAIVLVFVVMVNELVPPLYWPRALGTPASLPPPHDPHRQAESHMAGGWLTLVHLCKNSLFLDKLDVLHQRPWPWKPCGEEGGHPLVPLPVTVSTSFYPPAASGASLLH